MAPKIYTSHRPDVPLVHTSVFTRLFASPVSDNVGAFPGTMAAFVDAATGTTLTRARVKDLSLALAHGLRTHPTTRPFSSRGDTILIYSPNSLAWPVVLYGCIAAGLRCSFANSAYTARELAYQYVDSGAKLLFTAQGGLKIVEAMFSELGIRKEEADKRLVVLGPDLRWAGGPGAAASPGALGLLTMEGLLSQGALKEEEKFEGSQAHETVYLCYSSGTTGKPKAIETTHQNITTVVDIVGFDLPTLVPGVQPIIGILPFYHIYGLTQLVNLAFFRGWPVVIQSRFEPVEFCANIQRYKAVFAYVVPPVLVILARHPAVDAHDLSTLKYLVSAAAPLAPDLVHSVSQCRLNTKRHRANRSPFGITETSPCSHALNVLEADKKVGSIGHLLPNLEARLVHAEDGKIDADDGQPGELWLRGKTVMKASGYLNNAEATRNAITPDGWFKTGDIATRDNEGYYYIIDRRKELIKYSGFQVPPAELESVLLTHPDIADAAVIGVESVERATELPRAYVVHAHPEKVVSAQARAKFANGVAKWMETQVANHKFLRGGVSVINVVPKSAAGKILRRELRVLAAQEATPAEKAKL
ncbi:AMP binding protein [Mycena maculata]|uniref:AMP binding protein n=1 Tax=Mycena maculata TaxID=230809 RepID=A0AAD7MKM4_9AGAR|nr:AMP binding protein [Mycena maculata]